MAQGEQIADDDTVELLDNASHPAPGGLCGAILTDPSACALPAVDVRGRITEFGTDLRQKGKGVISKLRRESTSASEASLYDPSRYLCGAYGADWGEDEGNAPIPASEVGDPGRTVCVVTTAALPWRTGTAVNPLLRALYLVRFQNERREELLRRGTESEAGLPLENDVAAGDAAHAASTDTESQGSVALVIPWLEAEEDRIKLYGAANAFPDGPKGIQAQEEWIRDYAATRCGMPREATELKLLFYPAFYLAGFGSIFPKVDLCNFIPRELVDVAILEEPEHLNWFRMPNSNQKSMRDIGVEEAELGEEANKGGNDDAEHDCGDSKQTAESGVFGQQVEVTINESESSHLAEVVERPAVDRTPDGNVASQTNREEGNGGTNPPQEQERQEDQHPVRKRYIEKTKLGWTHRFRFVVGIVHTNYEAYARQYGIGASLIAAPAIGAVSALTIRAHCHQVIKLSDTLPSFAPGKEVTCNCHGVRREFLEGVDLDVLASAGKGGEDMPNAEGGDAPSPVYFIGKLVWAKGFDLMLELQDIFRKKKGGQGHYFSIDVYGGGPDEKAIARAFHGRTHTAPTKRPSAPTSKESTLSASSSQPADPKDVNAAVIMTNPVSIKDQSSRVIQELKQRRSLTAEGGSGIVDDVVAQYLSVGFEVCSMGNATYVKESRRGLNDEQGDAALAASSNDAKNPLDILGDLSGKSFDTGVKTSQAVYNIADSSIKSILAKSFSQLKRRRKGNGAGKTGQGDANTAEDEDDDKPHFVFDPPASRWEMRRHPIPARFPGVIDHAQLKNAPHKIFLNPSTSEVLCTTTAEALAMNKFAIIPRHPSNEFFLQFTNCLPYDTLKECAERMAWALENTPATLSEEERRKFTWEAATERLLESSVVTVKQARERAENGMDKTDARIAYWLSESGEKSNMIRNLFHKEGDRSPLAVDD